MIVNLTYSNSELEGAIDYIAKNNKRFASKRDEIRRSILDTIRSMADVIKPGCLTCHRGTMGYIIHVGDVEMESIDHDFNEVHVDIYVDPCLGKRKYNEEDIVTEVVNINYHDGEYLKDK